MKFYRYSIVFFVLLLSACSSHEQPKLAPLVPSATILAFGDSLTAGVGVHKEQAYPAILSQLIGHKVMNAGVSGEKTTGGLARLAKLLKQVHPQVLILCEGGNDMLRKQSLVQLKQNLANMIVLAQQEGIEVILIGVPKPGIRLQVPKLYPELAQQYHLAYDGNTLPELLSNNQYKSDLIHLNAKGYNAWALAIAELMRKTGLIGD
tara:strand:- start:56097 stop:56714 length:618 start_codon:yes stop_codon:yes gene_type:complete